MTPVSPVSEEQRQDWWVEEEHGIDEQEPWLISYADLMTLLFSLFAMMFSFATFDEAAAQKVEKALAKHFSDPNAATTAAELSEKFKAAIAESPHLKVMDLKLEEKGLEIKFGSATLFDSGKAILREDARKTVEHMIDLIRQTGHWVRVRVEGHTDDNTISTSEYPSNWELSGARASTIVRLFEQSGFPSERLEAIGYGSTRPALPNRGPAGDPLAENQASNRRVLVKILFEGD
jgi:chemotaxis protein MotB